MDHVGELRARCQQVGDAGVAAAFEHGARSRAGPREIKEDNAQSAIDDLTRHHHRCSGGLVALWRHEDRTRRRARDEKIGSILHRQAFLRLLRSRSGSGNRQAIVFAIFVQRVTHIGRNGRLDDNLFDLLDLASWSRLKRSPAEQFPQQYDQNGQHEGAGERGADDGNRPWEIGLGRRRRTGEHARVHGQIVAFEARGRFPMAGQIGLEQLALGGSFTFQCAQFHFLFAGNGGSCLELIELGHQFLLAALRGGTLPLERLQNLAALVPDLPIEIDQLGAQRTDAGVIVEQGRRQISDLGIDLDPAFHEPLHQGRRDHIRHGFDRTARLQRQPHLLRLCNGRRALRANTRQFRRELGKLLGSERLVVLAEKQVGAGAEFGDACFRFPDLPAKILDLGRQPTGRVNIRQHLRVSLDFQIGVRHRIGNGCCQFGVARGKLDHDDARALDTIDGKPLANSGDDALFRRYGIAARRKTDK